MRESASAAADDRIMLGDLAPARRVPLEALFRGESLPAPPSRPDRRLRESPGPDPACCGVCGEAVRGPSRLARDRLHHTPGVFRVVTCAECGHRQLAAPLDAEQLQRAYPDFYLVRGMAPEHDGSWRARLMCKYVKDMERRRVEIVQRYAALDGHTRALDVGCGNATFMEALREAGVVEASGTEMDAASVQRAGRKGFSVFRGSLSEIPIEPQSLDVVSLWHVLEHLAAPAAELQRARRLLKPGGFVFIGVPDASGLTARLFGQYWFGADLPRHAHQFTSAEIAILAERTGFHLADVVHLTEAPALAGSLHNLLGLSWWDALRDNLVRWLLLAGCTIPLDHLLRFLGLGDWMIAVLQRPGQPGSQAEED